MTPLAKFDGFSESAVSWGLRSRQNMDFEQFIYIVRVRDMYVDLLFCSAVAAWQEQATRHHATPCEHKSQEQAVSAVCDQKY